MKRALCTALVPILAFLLLVSCSEKQDFGQYDDLAVIPTVEASVLYIEALERSIDQVSGLSFVLQELNFDACAE